jgi:hypothetical protein
MDPDLVRQQEEAEREAMTLAGWKPGMPPAAAAAALQAIAASVTEGSRPIHPADAGTALHHTRQAGQHSDGQSADPVLEGAIGERPRRYTAHSALWYLSQFMSFGLAGATMGGALGIATTNYMQLSAEAAKLVIFGPAGFFAIACAAGSLFTGRTAQPRASSGT